jgi:hypothetical protein
VGKRRGAVPAIYDAREFTEDAADGLRSNFAAANLLADVYVGRILKGEKLSDASNGEVSGAETQDRCLQCELTRTPYSRSRNRDLDSKNILTRPGIPGLERKSGDQITCLRSVT